jgi:hypothetical protein
MVPSALKAGNIREIPVPSLLCRTVSKCAAMHQCGAQRASPRRVTIKIKETANVPRVEADRSKTAAASSRLIFA